MLTACVITSYSIHYTKLYEAIFLSEIKTYRLRSCLCVQAIFDVTKLAFETHPFSSKTEQFIINQLRKNNVLTISLVAEIDQVVIGHIAFSPVVISSSAKGWYGLGPVSVHPDHQRAGIGSKLIIEGLHLLKSKNANGCVVLGEPDVITSYSIHYTKLYDVPDKNTIPNTLD